MERVEALKRILAATRGPRLELTSAVVSADRTIVEVRWFEEPVFHPPGRYDNERHTDPRGGMPKRSAHLRYDFDATTGAPLSTRAPKRMCAAFAAALAQLDAARPAANAA